MNGLAIIPVIKASDLEAEAMRRNEATQQQPVVSSLAAHVRRRWEIAKDAKRDIEERLLDNLRRRRGEYSPTKLREIKAQGGSEIFMGITSVKCRAASAWLRDTLMGTGVDRPWCLEHTPIPDLPTEVLQQLKQAMVSMLEPLYMAGQVIDQEALRQQAAQMKEAAMKDLLEQAKKRVEKMEAKMEDQLLEGGWLRALSQFIDDLVTFPAAIIKGPVMRKRKVMKWVNGGLVPVEELRMEWERVDPFMFYPAPWAENPNDGFVIERHKLTRDDLQALIGVEGYNADAIRSVLAEFDSGGLNEWLWVDTVKADAEGRITDATTRSKDLIDALQLWDSVTGKMLVEWGIPETEIEDLQMTYPCEVWLIGSTVIKAVLNYDPLGRKPYYATSYEKIPGAFWGNSIPDLVRDPQDMCNAAARALANNMGIASGPQCYVNVSRLPPGEQITQMYPWKIWQTVSADFADSSKPIEFFQPSSNAAELLGVFEKFSIMADEYSGIPKYMAGEHVPGVSRTSSGLSMLISNASKALKQVVNNIDHDVITPMLERQYQHNLRYSQDPDLIGDVNIVAKGAMSLVTREAAAVRRNEFLQIVLQSPLAQQIVGLNGAAELLRENARLLDINTDRIVPPREAIEQMLAAQQAQQEAIMQAMMQPETENVQFQRDENGAVVGAVKQKPRPILPDGSLVGGRDSNFISSRPNLR